MAPKMAPKKAQKKVSREHIPIDIRRQLHEKYKQCANFPNSGVIKDYCCPMWLLYNGYFDASEYEIDHIDEVSKTNDNSLSNLQLLCACCHKIKTKVFMKNKCIFTSTEIANGACLMDVVEECGKKRKR